MNKKKTRLKRVLNFRKKIFNYNLNRLSVFKSNKYVYCQIISGNGNVLISISSIDFFLKKYIFINFGKNCGISVCLFLGKCIAYKALLLGINKVVFDRSGYKFHGCIKSICFNARKFGLNF